MTDINKQIEGKAREYAERVLRVIGNNQLISLDRVANDYAQGYKDALNSSRWRKVSEELPEYGSIIVAKEDTSDFQNMYLIEVDSDYSMSVLTSYYKEWKPID